MPLSRSHLVLVMRWHVLWLFHLLTFINTSSCLRLRLLKVPESRPAGYDVKLSCDIDLEGDVLYTIRWFHNDKEFYRYSPNDEPSAMFFPTRGIYLDVNRSTNTSVVLQDLDSFSAGLFRCEVVADAPHFQTVTAEAFMFIGEFYNGVRKKENYEILIIILSVFVKMILQ